jgi:hypothetical protein
MQRVPPRRGGGAGVVVKSIPNVMPQRVVTGNTATIQVRPMPNITVQSQPKYQ